MDQMGHSWQPAKILVHQVYSDTQYKHFELDRSCSTSEKPRRIIVQASSSSCFNLSQRGLQWNEKENWHPYYIFIRAGANVAVLYNPVWIPTTCDTEN